MTKITKSEALRAGTRMVGKQAKSLYEQSLSCGKENPKLKILADLLADESFGERFLFTTSPRAAQVLFAENGLELSPAEVSGIAQRIKMTAIQLLDSANELNDPALAMVAGGTPETFFVYPVPLEIDWPLCAL